MQPFKLTKEQQRIASEATQTIISRGQVKTSARIITPCDAPRSFRDAEYNESVGVVRVANASYTYSMRAYQNEALAR